MRPEDASRLFRHLEIQPSNRLDQRIDELLDSLPKAPPVGLWRRAMQNRVTRLALAAAVLMAVVIAAPWFNGDKSNVWAHALDNARNIGDYAFRSIRTEKSLDPQQSEPTSTPSPAR